MGAFVYGRKTGRIGTIIGGGILTVFPYFVSNPVLIALIGTVIVIGMYLFPE
jgi:VIT1/CCC1 family predicted Fe2+/Mn2+ transporter